MKTEADTKKKLDRLFKRLSHIALISKCSGCSCLLDTMKEFREASRGTRE
jgi:hypothetical protein